MYQPTAQVEPSEVVVAANRSFSPLPVFGVATTSTWPVGPEATKVLYGAVLLSRSPTMLTSVPAEVTPSGMSVPPVSLGEGDDVPGLAVELLDESLAREAGAGDLTRGDDAAGRRRHGVRRLPLAPGFGVDTTLNA